MLTKRIIPCLDIKNGRTVKGINFENLRDAGDPVELAKAYVKQGADELVFLDITATNEKRKTLCELVSKIAQEINIPFTVGGGVHSLEDAEALLQAGADKISLNTAAVENPALIKQIAQQFGNQCVVVAVDAKFTKNDWFVVTHAGTKETNLTVSNWVKECQDLGAGEILLTSMDKDGTKSGFDLALINEASANCSLPIIASGGAGKKDDFFHLFSQTKASAGLAASIFHYGEVSIPGLKRFLAEEGIAVRQEESSSENRKDPAVITVAQIDFKKCNGLVPAIIQHYLTGEVLMLGFMNEEAFLKTQELGQVTFFSRTKNRLWTKGETSNNYLNVKEIRLDCDNDTLLILAEPLGPVCHTGEQTCFGDTVYKHPLQFLETLDSVIESRKVTDPASSYTANLFRKGLNYISKKFGEEATEVVIAALVQDEEAFKGEVSDLLYHLLVLLKEKNIALSDIVQTLEKRHK